MYNILNNLVKKVAKQCCKKIQTWEMHSQLIY